MDLGHNGQQAVSGTQINNKYKYVKKKIRYG